MREIYRIISANIKKYEKNNYSYFDLEITLHNNEIIYRSSYLKDNRRAVLAYEYNGGIDVDYDTYKILLSHQFNMNFMIGKYIDIDTEVTARGRRFGHIYSWDLIDDFKRLLEINPYYPDFNRDIFFFTHISIYKFLTLKKYSKNNDGLIRLKGDYNHLVVDENNNCFSYMEINESDLDPKKFVTMSNIREIYNGLYKERQSADLDITDSYRYLERHILYSYTKHGKNTSKIQHSGRSVALKVGDL